MPDDLSCKDLPKYRAQGSQLRSETHPDYPGAQRGAFYYKDAGLRGCTDTVPEDWVEVGLQQTFRTGKKIITWVVLLSGIYFE